MNTFDTFVAVFDISSEECIGYWLAVGKVCDLVSFGIYCTSSREKSLII